MKTLFRLALVLPLTACSGDELSIRSLTSLFDGTGASARDEGQPTTRPLDGPIEPVARPSRTDLPDMTVTSLLDGSRKHFAVERYGNGVRVRQSNGCTWTRAGDWFSPSDSWARCGESRNWHTARATVRELDSLYPLQVGSVGRYERRAVSHTGRKQSRETRCEVSDAVALLRPGREATPVFVVDCEDPRRRRTTWFAPGQGPLAFRIEHKKKGLEEAWIRTD